MINKNPTTEIMILDFVSDEAEEAGEGVLVAAAAAEGVVEVGGGAGAVAVETTVATAGGVVGALNLQRLSVLELGLSEAGRT